MNDMNGSPVTSRRRLSAALRRARDDAGFTQEQVASDMDWSLSKIIRIERGTVGVSTSDLRMLLQHYRIDDATLVEHLISWAKVSRSRPWWSPYRERLPSTTFEALLGLETDASSIGVFNCATIPGLLQTPAYAKSLLANFQDVYLPPEDADVRLLVRLRRQEEVLRRRPSLDVVIDEAVLRRATGDAATMHDQLQHLLTLGNREEISVLIVPFSAGPYVASGSFSILSFDEADDNDAVYLELFDTDTIIEEPTEVARYRRLFLWTRDRALDRAASAELIRQVADEFA